MASVQFYVFHDGLDFWSVFGPMLVGFVVRNIPNIFIHADKCAKPFSSITKPLLVGHPALAALTLFIVLSIAPHKA